MACDRVASNVNAEGPVFNSGKMLHLFKQDSAWMYHDEVSCDDAREAMELGTVYLKVDGSNGAIEIDDKGDIKCWQR